MSIYLLDYNWKTLKVGKLTYLCNSISLISVIFIYQY